MKVVRPNFEKREGNLVVVVTQDATTKQVLMVAYADETAWRRTLETGIATYYSTSRKKLWVKGEESGNFLKMVDMRIDCDGDALVYLVEPQGNKLACHTNAKSCFFRSVTGVTQDEPAPKISEKEHLSCVEVDTHSHFFQ